MVTRKENWMLLKGTISKALSTS